MCIRYPYKSQFDNTIGELMRMFSITLNCLKKIAIAVCALVIAISLTACTAPRDKVIASLGRYENYVFFTSGGFQDYTDYAKYDYSSAEVAENKYLKKIQESDLMTIHKHLDDFEGWIEVIRRGNALNEVVVNYDFDRAIIDMEDSIYIDSEEHTWTDGSTSLVKYNIYFFDVQTQILYYFHNNI